MWIKIFSPAAAKIFYFIYLFIQIKNFNFLLLGKHQQIFRFLHIIFQGRFYFIFCFIIIFVYKQQYADFQNKML